MRKLSVTMMLFFALPIFGSIAYAQVQTQAPEGYNLGTKKNCAAMKGGAQATMAKIGIEEQYATKALDDKDWAKLDRWIKKRDKSLNQMASYSVIYSTWCK
jgi:hypothetical protein